MSIARGSRCCSSMEKVVHVGKTDRHHLRAGIVEQTKEGALKRDSSSLGRIPSYS